VHAEVSAELITGFEILRKLSLKITVFQVVTQCSMVEVNRGFGGTSNLPSLLYPEVGSSSDLYSE
jgi:hypothetical protein